MDLGKRNHLIPRAALALFAALMLALACGASSAAASSLGDAVDQVGDTAGSTVKTADHADAQLTPAAPSKVAARDPQPAPAPSVPAQPAAKQAAPVVHSSNAVTRPTIASVVAASPRVPTTPVSQVAHVVAGVAAPVAQVGKTAAGATPVAKVRMHAGHTVAAVTAPLAKTLGQVHVTSPASKALGSALANGGPTKLHPLAGSSFGRISGGGPTATTGGGAGTILGPPAGPGSVSAPAGSILTGPGFTAGAFAPTGGVLAFATAMIGSGADGLAGLPLPAWMLPLLGGAPAAANGGHGASGAVPVPSAPSPTPGPLDGSSPAFAGTPGFGFLIFLLAGLLVLGAPFAARKLRLAGESCGASAFVLIPERPG